MTNLKILTSKRVENVPNHVEDNGHGFTKLNVMTVMLNDIKTLLEKMQNCRVLKVRTPMTFEMTFDPQITGRATMGMRFKNNPHFPAWREV